MGGQIALRNDNPQNIILKPQDSEQTAMRSKEKGNYLFKLGLYSEAIDCYKQGVDLFKNDELSDHKLLVILLSNISQCYMNHNLFEDALLYVE